MDDGDDRGADRAAGGDGSGQQWSADDQSGCGGEGFAGVGVAFGDDLGEGHFAQRLAQQWW